MTKLKWDIPCACTMMVLDVANDQYRVMYLTKCKDHKADRTNRIVWKHQVVGVS